MRLLPILLLLLILTGCASTPRLGDRIPGDWCRNARVDVQINATTTMVWCRIYAQEGGRDSLAYLVQGGFVFKSLGPREVDAIYGDAVCRSHGIDVGDEQYPECRIRLDRRRLELEEKAARDRAVAAVIREQRKWISSEKGCSGCRPPITYNPPPK